MESKKDKLLDSKNRTWFAVVGEGGEMLIKGYKISDMKDVSSGHLTNVQHGDCS